MTALTRRDVELIDVALDSAASACDNVFTASTPSSLAQEYRTAGTNLAAHLDFRADLAALLTKWRAATEQAPDPRVQAAVDDLAALLDNYR